MTEAIPYYEQVPNYTKGRSIYKDKFYVSHKITPPYWDYYLQNYSVYSPFRSVILFFSWSKPYRP